MEGDRVDVDAAHATTDASGLARDIAGMTADMLRVERLQLAGVGEREAAVFGPLDLMLDTGDSLAVVGGAGSGKSLLARAIAHRLPQGIAPRQGRVLVAGHDVLRLGRDDMLRLRRRTLTVVPQAAGEKLDPRHTIGRLAFERPGLRHRPEVERFDRMTLALGRLRVEDPARMMQRHPHEFSAATRQRVALALALASEPALMVLDEPTAGLDPTLAVVVFDLLADLRRDAGTAVLTLTRHLGVAAWAAERVGVLRGGVLVEEAPAERLYVAPRHPAARAIVSALPRALDAAPPDSTAAPTLRVEGLGKTFRGGGHTVRALAGISFDLGAGETLAVLGEAGSGQATLLRTVVGEIAAESEARMTLDGALLAPQAPARSAAQRDRLRLLFPPPDRQSRRAGPFGRILSAFGRWAGRWIETAPPPPSEGERGGSLDALRAALDDPQVHVAVLDGPSVGLDGEARGQAIALLRRLRLQGRAVLLATSDPGLARAVADRLMLLYRGRIMEIGPAEAVVRGPHHPYTEALFAAVAVVDGGWGGSIRLRGEPPDALLSDAGCVFYPRCPRKIGRICEIEAPVLRPIADGHEIACHHPASELGRLAPTAA